MKLVFIHGWGFDASFWDKLAPQLSDHEQQRFDLGFFGAEPTVLESKGNVLIGHSLGFVHGMAHDDWAGFVAINSFPRFIDNKGGAGCTDAATLRAVRQQVIGNTPKALKDFYSYYGASQPRATTPNTKKLVAGLDELRDADRGATLAAWKKPALVLAAESDPMVTPNISSAINANIKWNDSASHVLPQSDAAWCADVVNDFLQKNFA